MSNVISDVIYLTLEQLKFGLTGAGLQNVHALSVEFLDILKENLEAGGILGWNLKASQYYSQVTALRYIILLGWSEIFSRLGLEHGHISNIKTLASCIKSRCTSLFWKRMRVLGTDSWVSWIWRTQRLKRMQRQRSLRRRISSLRLNWTYWLKQAPVNFASDILPCRPFSAGREPSWGSSYKLIIYDVICDNVCDTMTISSVITQYNVIYDASIVANPRKTTGVLFSDKNFTIL